ncbi:hypothetical protein M1627_2860 [Sulfolobus islandicus M.16.27]|uniref:Uncharacterized protein n=1 Tax=Saccharolobus islandicus (strain M.16.27) TaxID=427318 RepID=C3N602_SACI3|nr:hypothetical protein M1627_2860 [Sulfolobus islandicus M.16.27]
MKVIKPETDEVLVINNSEELRKLFEELKRDNKWLELKKGK